MALQTLFLTRVYVRSEQVTDIFGRPRPLVWFWSVGLRAEGIIPQSTTARAASEGNSEAPSRNALSA